MVRRSLRRAGGAAEDRQRQAAAALLPALAKPAAAAARIRRPAQCIPQPGGTRAQAAPLAGRLARGRIARIAATVGFAPQALYADAAGTRSQPRAGAAGPCA